MRLDPLGDHLDIVFDLIQGRESEPIVAAVVMSESLRHLGQRPKHNTHANRSIRKQISAMHEARARSIEETAGYL
jgi:hypothetical protein